MNDGPSVAGAIRVLVVEDDKDIRRAIRYYLEDCGFSVGESADGREALERLRGEFSPDVILLDLLMPVVDGEAFCEERRSDPRLASIPVILLTAYEDDSEAVRSRLGAQAFLKKPIRFPRLVESIRELVASPKAPLTPPATR